MNRRVRRWIVVLTGLSLLLLPACASGRSSGGGDEPKKVLFVGRGSVGDQIVMNRLRSLGFEVTLRDARELTPEEAENYTLTFVSSSVNSGHVKNKLLRTTKPVIYTEPQNMGDIDLAGRASDVDNGDFTGKSVKITAPDHPIASGLQGAIEVYKSEGKLGFIVPVKEASVVAVAPDNEKRALIVAFEKGVKNKMGEALPARRAFFYLVEGEEVSQNENGWKLFDATVLWSIGEKK